MPFQYVSVEEAIERNGLRMVVVSNVPSVWGEAAKSIFHVKGIEWVAVRLVYDNETLNKWAGPQRNAPVAIYERERPRLAWNEILLLAERLAPTPSLLPRDAAERALMFGLSHELCGEGGLAWSRRVQLVHAGLNGGGGFDERVANYLGRKYGYSPEVGAAAPARIAALLRMLADRLESQRKAGSRYYLGATLTALDIYSAACMAMFSPLPHDQCAMDPAVRAALETRDPITRAALAPILLEHRDMIYAQHLELPLSL
jgi:glutathione S-transferase